MNQPNQFPEDVARAARTLLRLAESLGMRCQSSDVERRMTQTWPDATEGPIRGAEWLARAADDQGLRVQRIEGPVSLALEYVERGQVAGAHLRTASGALHWVALLGQRGGKLVVARFGEGLMEDETLLARSDFEREYVASAEWVVLDLATPNAAAESEHAHAPMSEWKRLLALVQPDRGDIVAVAVFAIAIGVLQLATPVAVQALVNFVALGGAISPVLVVAFMLMLGLGFAGALSATQTWIVEILQRRIFVRMVADLAARLPRVKAGAHHYGPELINRFFDIVSIQKLGAALLLDGLALLLTVAVGLVLLAFYHPLLLAFDLVLLVVIALLVLLPLRRGVRTAVEESRVKFATEAWLEEIARNPLLFKTSGAQRWVYDVADRLAGEYVARRRQHFRVVFGQVIGAQALRMIASTVLLAIGGMLVIQGDLTLGQLVAAEIIVSLVVDSVAKTGKHLENFYDLMAATGKVGKLLDLPLEPHAGEHHEPPASAPGVALSLSKVACNRSGGARMFSDLSLELPAGGTLCIRGPSGVGKSSLVQVLWGLRAPSAGSVRIDGRDLRELACDSLRRTVAIVSGSEVVNASVRDNVRIGRTFVSDDDVRSALARVGLLEELSCLPAGLDTELDRLGHPLSEGQLQRLLVARAIAGRPRLLVVEDVLDSLNGETAENVEKALFDPASRWTLIVVSNREDVAARCGQVLELPSGRVTASPSPDAPKVA